MSEEKRKKIKGHYGMPFATKGDPNPLGGKFSGMPDRNPKALERKKVRVQYGVQEKDLNKGGVSSHAKTDMGGLFSKQKDDF